MVDIISVGVSQAPSQLVLMPSHGTSQQKSPTLHLFVGLFLFLHLLSICYRLLWEVEMKNINVEELIKEKAYQFYEQRMRLGAPGDHLTDWQNARDFLGLWHCRVQDYAWYKYCARLSFSAPGSAESDWFAAERQLAADSSWWIESRSQTMEEILKVRTPRYVVQ
ncbi:MAG: hypothetical protein ABR875_03770 [Minisyncoccia bacterium]